MQSLFEWDFNGAKSDVSIKGILDRNIKEFAPGLGDFSFIESLAKGVMDKRKEIDSIIEKAAPDWPLDKISVVDRNILRVGLYELLFSKREEVPPKVAINEAIELAKTFGGENSGKFVNGVLGAVYKEIGEPGKEDKSRKTKIKQEIDPAKFPIEKLGGAVVYSKKDDEFYLALVHDVFGYWTLSKGHIEDNETIEDGTEREIKKETGLDMKIKSELGYNEYIASDPEKGKIRKQVTYFLGEAPYKNVVLGSSGGLDDVRWFKLSDVAELRIYDDIIPIITKGINIITSKKT